VTSPAFSVPGVLDALRALSKAANDAADQAGLPRSNVHIAAINTWNRLNVTTGQIAGEWTAQWAA
jgi:hypothetical protein